MIIYRPNRRDLKLLLRCYVASVNKNHFEEIIKNKIITPLCKSLITQETLDGDTRHSYNGLENILNTLYNYSSNKFKVFNDIANLISNPINQGEKAFDLLNNSLWRGITEYFINNYSDIFVYFIYIVSTNNVTISYDIYIIYKFL